jgi:hypothetical protein
MVRLKALVVFPNDKVEDYSDLLAIGRTEAKRLLKTHENVNVKDNLYSARCSVHVVLFKVPDSVRIVASCKGLDIDGLRLNP